MAKLDLTWTEVDSSNVKAVALEERTHTLCVLFHNGGLYTYAGVPSETYSDLVHAESVGRYLNQVIKGMYPYTRWLSMLDLMDNLAAK